MGVIRKNKRKRKIKQKRGIASQKKKYYTANGEEVKIEERPSQEELSEDEDVDKKSKSIGKISFKI